MRNKLTSFRKWITSRLQIGYKKITGFIDRKPLLSFFIVLALFVGLIVISNLLPKPAEPQIKADQTKQVQTYNVGQAPRLTVQAQIKKTGVIQVVALTNGVVNQINVTEGTKVNRGQLLLGMSSNYAGGNSASLQRQIADQQYKNSQQTFPIQKDLISKQRDIANKTQENSEQLRNVQRESIDETNVLIGVNTSILDVINDNISDLEQNPAANEDALLAARSMRSQFQAALNQARSGLRELEYQTDVEKPAVELQVLTKESTLKQLELQEKQLAVSQEVARLQLLVAQVNEALYYPSAPFAGVVERVFVKYGESVNPGTPLFTLSQTESDDPVTAIAYVSKEIAQNVSMLEPSTLHLGNETEDVSPSYITTEAVQGNLYAIYYPIPESFNKKLTNDGYITVDVPIGYPDTSSAVPYLPLDAVYQTRQTAYIFVVVDGKVVTREVQLGSVFGSFVEVKAGLKSGDEVILDRTVVEGEKVQTQ